MELSNDSSSSPEHSSSTIIDTSGAARAAIAKRAAFALFEAQGRVRTLPVAVGFDAFIDSIISVVDKRASMDAGDYSRLETITRFADRVAAAAGKSTNLELVIHEQRFGGNGPLMAGGLAQFGLPTTYLGGVGAEGDDVPRGPGGPLHAIFQPFVDRCTRTGGTVIPLSSPARTEALEFDDGKVMMGKPAPLQSITWERLKALVGVETLTTVLGGAQLVGIVNWVMMGGVEGIWEGLADEVFAQAGSTPRVFLDLCDPAKRTDADVASALKVMSKLAGRRPVTLGLNLAEAERIDAVCGSGSLGEMLGVATPSNEQLRCAAVAIRAKLRVDTVVIHPRHGAAAANAAGVSAWFDGPLIAQPKLSTGAGDHFNSGFALGQLLGLPLELCLACAVGTSGAYVRDAQSPTLVRLAEFLAELPEPQG